MSPGTGNSIGIASPTAAVVAARRFAELFGTPTVPIEPPSTAAAAAADATAQKPSPLPVPAPASASTAPPASTVAAPAILFDSSILPFIPVNELDLSLDRLIDARDREGKWIP